MNIKEVLDFGTTVLKNAGVENPRLEAEILLSYFLDCDRIYFYAHPNVQVDMLQKEAYLKGLVRRCENEPMAYIFGKKEFMGMSFEVSPHVLIPRPDTEPMVEYLIQRLTDNYPKGAKIFDLCTGSGAIGIALKKFYPQGEITLGDISMEALAVAGANAKQLVEGKITLCQGDLFEALPKDNKFDVIVSNPPYIRRLDMKALAPDILNYEPHLALDGGASGLEFYERIIAEARDYLKTPGILALEIGDDQEVAVFDLLVKHGYVNIEKQHDLGGHVRCLVGECLEKKA